MSLSEAETLFVRISLGIKSKKNALSGKQTTQEMWKW